MPPAEHRDRQQEEEEFAQKLDELAARWKVHALQNANSQRPGNRFVNADFDEDDASDGDYVDGEEDDLYDDNGEDGWDAPEWEWDSEDEMDEGEWSDDRTGPGAAHERRRERRRRQRQRRRERQRQSRYPELKVENTEDGRLRVSRNVVLDTDDANEDGLQTMRVGLALVEFPSIVELYTEHQECSLAILKMEEDEEISTGFPFFMSESGDDDALIVSNYYNQVTLKVFDDGVRAADCWQRRWGVDTQISHRLSLWFHLCRETMCSSERVLLNRASLISQSCAWMCLQVRSSAQCVLYACECDAG